MQPRVAEIEAGVKKQQDQIPGKDEGAEGEKKIKKTEQESKTSIDGDYIDDDDSENSRSLSKKNLK